MSELQNRLDRLMLRLDHMAMRVEQAVVDAVAAVLKRDVHAGQAVHDGDAVIDREEVEIEQECIRLLALYQPAAIDLRTICTIIKVNSDLERIADLAARMARRVRHMVRDDLDLDGDAPFERLYRLTLGVLGRTVRMLGVAEVQTARGVIADDAHIDGAHRRFVRAVLDAETGRSSGAERTFTLISLAKALERIGDHCTNIAEDIVFLRTGDVIRHASAFEP